MSNQKIVSTLGAGITAVALGVAVFQYSQKREAEGALAAAQKQLHVLQSELANVSARLTQAERRATDAERDSGDLLKAAEATRVQQAARAARTAANSGARLPGPPAVMRPPEDEERLAQERSYQQALTKRRAEEAIARAKIDQDVATQSDASARFHRLIESAAHLATNAEFQAGIRMFNQAMEVKPADLPLSDEIKELQATLAAQNKPVEVEITSDGQTWVSIVNYRPPEKISTVSVKILPGNYLVTGRRAGYEDVVIPLQVRNGAPAPTLSVTCTTPVR
jgi:hypothetical protein